MRGASRITEALVAHLLLAALVLALAGCSTAPVPDSLGATSAVPPAAALPATSAPAIKSVPPLDIALELPVDTLAVGGQFVARLTVTPRQDARQVRGRLAAAGVVALTSTPAFAWNAVAANRDLTAQATFRISGLGSGELSAGAELLGDTGVRLYDRVAVRYFLVTKEEILVGTNGLQALELEHLEHLRSAGRLTQADYEKARERVLGGGAVETNPTATP